MEQWKLLLSGIRNYFDKKVHEIRGSVEVSNLPEVQHVLIDNPQEPTEKVEVSNLIDYKESLDKIIGELSKEVKPADNSDIINALKEVVRTLEVDKTDYSPIIVAIDNAVKQLKQKYPEFDDSKIVSAINELKFPEFNFGNYLNEGELPVLINEKQIKKLVEAFGKKAGQIVSASVAGSTTIVDNRDIYEVRVEVDSVHNDWTYIGKANPGAAESAAVWQMKKMIKTATAIDILWCDSNLLFDNVWDDRETLDYA